MKKPNSLSDAAGVLDLKQLTVMLFGDFNSALYQRTKKHIIKNNIIPSFKLGKSYYVKKIDAEAWLQCASGSTSE
jgi:hypothetical protein